MVTDYKHLHASVIPTLNLPQEERIARIRAPRWIGYPKAKEALRQLEQLLAFPKRHRMPNLLLTGETNNGKTMILRQFFRHHQAKELPDNSGVDAPVIIAQTPAVPDEKRLYTAILDRVFSPYRSLDNVSKLQAQSIKMLKYCHTHILVLDEIHNMLASSTVKQKGFLNALKFLSNELEISIVLAGTRDAVRAIHTDPQMANRFTPFSLPPWQLNASFLQLLASFEHILPLKKPSNLPDHALAAKLLALSDGKIGELSEILELSAIHAVVTGSEQITEKTLAAIDYVSPVDRRRNAEQYGT